MHDDETGRNDCRSHCRIRTSSAPEPFFFGVPLISPEGAEQWSRVDELLSLTVSSISAQRDRRFRVLLAGHEPPPCWRQTAGDPRFAFLEATWDPQSPTLANDDGGAKKWLIRNRVRELGGGLLMFVDADDLVDHRLVEIARSRIAPSDAGGIVGSGLAIDFETGCAIPLPHPDVHDGPFHSICGSSVIGRLPAEDGAADPFEDLGSHHQWPEAARSRGETVRELPVYGGYLVNTGESHSERHGPFWGWKRELVQGVVREGRPLGPDLLRLFGIVNSPPAKWGASSHSRPAGSARDWSRGNLTGG